MKRLILVIGILILFATEIFRVYFIMPFPGSQRSNTIDLAYFIDRSRLWLRILGFVLVGYALLIHPAKRRNPYTAPRKKSSWPVIALLLVAALYAVIFFFFNFRFEADKMFHQPKVLAFTDSSNHDLNGSRLVIGVVVDNQAKAYPIQLIGYHHQVRDTVGRMPIMVTYCTVCRTGRVYSPLVHGRPEEFRLVGMDHFNAMFEDERTKSWWQQATGIAVAGPLKGQRLDEIPSAQYTMAEWLHIHPGSAIMEPDPNDTAHYSALRDYDNGSVKGGLEHRDSTSWQPKSWVVGVVAGNNTKAYDWNLLDTRRMVEDTIGSIPVLIYCSDSLNFQVFNRVVTGQTLYFASAKHDLSPLVLADSPTHSVWTPDGLCIGGPLKGQHLQPLQSYQEFWHSWSHFHPATTQYNP